MVITEVFWKRNYAWKLVLKHAVHTSEAEQVLGNRRACFRRMQKGYVRGEDLFAAYGRTDSGRYLVVFFIRKGTNVAMPISARDMTTSERRYHEKHS